VLADAVESAVKGALADPAGIVTEAGTVSAAMLAETATTMPPEGDAPLSVIVHVVDPPDWKVAGLH